MKRKLIYILPVLLAFVSCQKVIDVDLNEANAVTVIEANYTAEDSTVNVHISMTSSYFDSDPSPLIDNASVTITDHLGVITGVPSIGGGDYQLTNYIPNYGTTYTLTVACNGVTYTAECDMNPAIQLEDITYEYFPGFFGGDGGYGVYLNVNDPVGLGNHYQIILTENGVEHDDLLDMFIQDDLLNDGNFIERPLWGKFFDTTDVVGMELRSIDGEIYDYINQAIGTAGGQDSAAPGNPDSNWDNGAVGYFSAYSNSRKEVTIL